MIKMDFKLHKDFSEIDISTWNALVEQSITDTPFSRYEYLSEWWKTLGGGEWKNAELVLVSASENDQLIGIAPLFIAEYDNQQALLLIGSIEISDYLDLIVREQDLPRFLSGLIDFLASSLPDTSIKLRAAGAPSIGITSPIALPPSPPSKRTLNDAAGTITKKSIVPLRVLH